MNQTLNLERLKNKKVALLLPWLRMGGTNVVALRFASELSKYCDVTLILSENVGELLQDVPENVHVIIDQMKDFKTFFKNDLKQFRIKNLFKDARYYFNIKNKKDGINNYSYIVKRNHYVTDTVFDCAISFHGQSPERLLNLIYRVHSRKKAAWIHGEMSFSKQECHAMGNYYRMLDHLFFVSTATMESFLKIIDFNREQTTVYYNPIDTSKIISLSDQSFSEPFETDYINILTVGRISPEKGQNMIPEITRKLLDKGYKVRWYLIGNGPSEKNIHDLINKYHVENNVYMLGVKNNPYCYMKACDLYVQPSYTEGYSTTICEAGILGKAIIGTKTSGGIAEQITDGIDGMIVDPTAVGLQSGIEKLINDQNMKKKLEENILKKDFTGKGEIDKFLQYLNS